MVRKYYSGLLLLALGLCGISQILRTEATVSMITGTLYQTTRGLDLQPPCLALEQNVLSKVLCVGLCQRHASCKAGSYHVTRKTCCLREGRLLHKNVTPAKDNDSWYFQPAVDYDGWTLAFKADAGTDLAVLSYWQLSGRHDDPRVGKRELEYGCWNADGSRVCTSNYRSKYLDDWDTLNIKQVSYRMYENGENVVNIIFNGTGSTMTSWMTKSRLLQTPWPDMITKSPNRFGVSSDPRRHFFINEVYPGCDNDTGWIIVADYAESDPPCSWERHPPYPVFIYSTKSTSVVWKDAQGFAEVMAIFIKF